MGLTILSSPMSLVAYLSLFFFSLQPSLSDLIISLHRETVNRRTKKLIDYYATTNKKIKWRRTVDFEFFKKMLSQFLK